MRAMAGPSTCPVIDSSSHPAFRRDVKGSERGPKSRDRVASSDWGRPKPFIEWHGLRASVVVKDGNAVIMAKGCRQFVFSFRRSADAEC